MTDNSLGQKQGIHRARSGKPIEHSREDPHEEGQGVTTRESPISFEGMTMAEDTKEPHDELRRF
jgi:hypothetical protein